MNNKSKQTTLGWLDLVQKVAQDKRQPERYGTPKMHDADRGVLDEGPSFYAVVVPDVCRATDMP
ncbi:hypothetical protein F441_10364 [Phytophthora nicotianae CJ01A1]|uniref:Uncharacterized protein n=6 Tax=Phytophthora nicotianae TaxID=4792 RepID=W2RB24_PHYN3|nr:hypothetical protein PPTG_21125 [Phytophthora nicotianae INRA-310]ETI44906.1 hypothetical protein F443_10421 [Phytophthora nicotianae P1569]ETL91425.1 hypothetical protein L917_10026 [Phytophthora nicotianae]ETO73531.1 hypothetical protein F444_10525 [Phytophthora nicotianae P1976]ETP14716.1 hypothetical protein F441_10364 [Phytophthora nicotianae CJ01A1]ETP42783.1 hypothetical protein F442_10329 [Phytophthora nicotianae P10297]